MSTNNPTPARKAKEFVPSLQEIIRRRRRLPRREASQRNATPLLQWSQDRQMQGKRMSSSDGVGRRLLIPMHSVRLGGYSQNRKRHQFTHCHHIPSLIPLRLSEHIFTQAFRKCHYSHMASPTSIHCPTQTTSAVPYAVDENMQDAPTQTAILISNTRNQSYRTTPAVAIRIIMHPLSMRTHRHRRLLSVHSGCGRMGIPRRLTISQARCTRTGGATTAVWSPL